MNKSKGLLGNAFAALYFIVCMTIVLFVLALYPIMFPSEVSAIMDSGFAGPNSSISFIGVCGLVIGVSMLIPPLRRMYRALPWLYPFVKIFFLDLILLGIGVSILNYGYQTVNPGRHSLFLILMIVEIIVGRIAICIYFKINPAKSLEVR